MLTKEELLNEFFIKEKNYRFNISKFSKMKDDDIRKISLKNYYDNSSSLRETYIRLRNNWDEIPLCPTCGKPLKWLDSKSRFQNHCSSSCAVKNKNAQEKHKNTCLKKYGDENYNNHKKQEKTMLEKYGIKSALCDSQFRLKGEQTKLNKYGSITYNNPNKTTETCIKKYKTGRNNKKAEDTMLKKYGVKSYLSSSYINSIRNNTEIQEKIQKTLKLHNTLNTSKPEQKSYIILQEIYPDVIHHYKDKERYPFNCDFYIPSLDLFIECQYGMFHNKRPYKGTEEQIKEVELLKEKSECIKINKGVFKTRYDAVIYTWTILDVKKRNIAKQNNINFKEFWSINELKQWINKNIKIYKYEKNKS